MHTLGYSFKPWTAAKAIADGPSILEYLRETVAEFGIDRHIRFEHHVERGRMVERRRAVDRHRDRPTPATTVALTCDFLFMCSGYYSYKRPATRPSSPASSDFAGQVVHPQAWPEDLDYAGKQVVVIGRARPR